MSVPVTGSTFNVSIRTRKTSAGTTVETAIDLTIDDENQEAPVPDLRPPGLQCLHSRPLSLKSLRPATRSSTLLSRHSYNARVQFKSKRKLRHLSPDLQVISGGHRNFSFWKDKYYADLKVAAEHQLAVLSIRHFEKRSITTVVPDRYLRLARAPKNGGLPQFPGVIEILPPVRAVKQAYEEHTPARQDTTRLVLWTDGSASHRHRGFAVVWRLSTATGWGDWEAVGYKAIGEVLEASGMEGLAVIKALDKARELALTFSAQFKVVAVYTDATSALSSAKDARCSLGQHMAKKAHRLRQLGTEISLHWCPGHSRV